MISYEEFEMLVDLLKRSYEECEKFNKELENIFGEDSVVIYTKQHNIVSEYVVRILELNGESHDGAEWFVYDGLEQIEKGGTEIGYHEERYNIKTIRDYYDWLMNLKKETK